MNVNKTNNKKRLLSILLMICMVVSLLPINAFAGSNQQGYGAQQIYYVSNKGDIGKTHHLTVYDTAGNIVEPWSFCLQASKGTPQYNPTPPTSHDGEYVLYGTGASAMEDWYANTNNKPNTTKRIINAMYIYEKDPTDLKGRLGLNDQQSEQLFFQIMQEMVYIYTDNHPLPNWSAYGANVQNIINEAKALVDRNDLIPENLSYEIRVYKDTKSNSAVLNQSIAAINFFENTPQVGAVEVQIPAKKTIDGGQTPIGNNTFTFKLTGNGQELTATSDENGNILFPAMTFTEAGTYTYTIEEVTDERDGVTFNFDKSQKTVTVTVSSHDVQTYDPDVTYYAFEELDENFDYYYYIDTVPGNKGIVMYCTYEAKSGPQDPDDVPVQSQTYRVVINPTVAEIEANGWVQKNLYGDELNDNLKKLFYYFETDEGKQISNGDKQSLVWTATGEPSNVSQISVNGRPASNNATIVLKNIYETVTPPPSYNLAFFIPTGTQAQEPPQGHPQPLATGYGAVVETTTNEVVFNNETIEADTGNLVITKTIEGDVTAEEAEGAITFKVTAPDGSSKEYTLQDFKNEDGKYTLELNDVLVGEYTVEETTKDIDGKTVVVKYSVNSGAETEGTSTKGEVTKGETATVDFKNSYSNDTGNLVITKTIEGDVTAEEAEGAITFKVTAPDGSSKEYTLQDFKNEDGKYTLELNDVLVGEYTVEETTKDIDGKTVVVKYSVNSGAETEGTSTKGEVTKGETATVDFKNSYSNDTGNLVITKTIEGDVTAEEAEGAITFKVTAPDGSSKEYTLQDFKNEDGKYTLELNDVLVGEYTVEETTKDIDGKTVVVKYSVNSGAETEGTSTKGEVTKGETATVDFKNSYSNDTGNLVITKTIEGDVTAEEAEGAITFKVTAPDGSSKEYTLQDFKNEDGKYTLELNDVLVGEYTVEETTKDIDGKTVVVKYSVNSGAETEGTSTKGEVTKGETATVDFKNSYSNDTGNLVITKTIEGDVTAEEAEGAITFKVTAPDGSSKEYTLQDFKNEDGKYTLELNDVLVGEYTVEETTKDIDGKTVVVKYSVNSGAETEGTSTKGEVTKGETATVDFKNSYSNDTGNLVITKTIEGDVTAEEAEGAITFKVTAPDGSSKEYTLQDFKNEDGKYTLELNDVLVGEYTVEETTKDIDGKTVVVKYSVNSGAETEGTSTKGEVTKGETATVDFKNSYSNDTGNLVITKTIEGDVTAEEAEGAITFKVTAPDGSSKEYTLQDFKNEDGKYTLELNDVLVGEYTVEETTKDIDGKTVVVKYSVNSGAETEGTSTKGEVTKGETATVDFKNSYSNDTGNLVITKTIEGDVTAEEAEGAITFKVTAPDGSSKEYTLQDFKNEDGKYTLELNDVLVGEYTVEETTKDIDGKTVVVKYSVNSGAETEGTSTKGEVTKGETATVDFKNSYSNDTGNLVITKTIEGDVTAEEAEGAITFKVTAPDGSSKEYTLQDFKNEDGKYTLELNDVLVGEYTVEETTKDIDGKTVVVKYSVNSGAETEGTSTKGEVTKGETATVDFKNSYSNDTGNLVITKTIEGDVTAEEAEGAITFKVTAPDGSSKEYTLQDFKNEDGKYTLELNDVLVGEYTVEETTKDIDGKTVVVKYSVNSGAETEGTSTKGEVTKGETATVDFKNSYSNDTGNLVITNDNSHDNNQTVTTKPSGKAPHTGDSTKMWIWEALMITSASILVALGYRRKKSK